jgi:serine/threonine protein kinase
MSNIGKFSIQKKLGEGSFSEVYAVTKRSNGEQFAMKKVKMGKLT